MARTKRKADIRVFRPRKHGKRWRIVIRDTVSGKDDYLSYPSEAEALEGYTKTIEEIADQCAPTSGDYLDDYRSHLLAKGNKPGSVTTTMYRLNFLAAIETPIASLDIKILERAILHLAGKVSVDTARNTLAEVKTYFRWLRKSGIVHQDMVSMLADIEIKGRRKKGKKQLRPAEARVFLDHCLTQAKDNEGSLAAAMALILGMRASEITSLVARDIDIQGQVLFIEGAKTEAGNRPIGIPEVLIPFLQAKLDSLNPTDRIFQDGHDRHWLLKQVKRICSECHLPEVPTHGLRGTHSSVSIQAGATGYLVAKQLGHADERTGREHYIDKQVADEQKQKKALRVLEGGKH